MLVTYDPTKAEPITRMLPSEALRLGRIAYPEVVDDWREGDAFCALGLINYVRGDDLYDNSINYEAGYQMFPFPCRCRGAGISNLARIVMHLSDYHDYYSPNRKWHQRLLHPIQRWTQRDIINWLVKIGY